MPGPSTVSAPVAVSARDFSWRHAGRRSPALSSLTLDIAAGEKVLLLGASGAGKSTLLHALAGVLGEGSGPDAAGEQHGSLTLDGVDPLQAHGRAGLVLQDPDSQLVLSRVGDEVAFGAENLRVPPQEIWERVRTSLDDVGLAVPLHHSTAALSGGQKQRLALASVLAMRPGLLLLDEPTANLDPDGVTEVRAAVERVLARTGATLIVVEHRVAVWADVVDRVVVLAAGGGILADGPPGQVLSDPGTRARLAAAGVWLPGAAPDVAGPAPGSPGAPLLEALGLSAGRPKAPAVLRGVDLELRAGSALGITGPNGAGKSTLALTLGGLLKPAAGTLQAAPALAGRAGTAPWRWKSTDLVTRIGTVFQEPEHQFLAPTVHDELAFGPRRTGHRSETDIAGLVQALAERLRLTALLDANPFTLSGGEKRRLSVATMIATEPDILLLDEPTFGQDANTWAELVGLLRSLLAEGKAVVSVTHDAEFLAALGGNLLRVEHGTALAGAVA
ncbi:energy-coupling factor ABC transporter ATP-binding protein [Arthrobacter jiangjiafuii]|uniref:Energy-coupling factor ABC transporter ATP-binding protein n=1 Tax=Arthrobacter jiangjiafuii TaxID=2817475 RepID=A0A975R0T8_9MICC|nr:ABC transporter ATP-binding protein [Arthrobacter jiangjiafuii]MBP3042488.1 ABC transporter ATP-binding protein [Arthrobacter jiangjiafuii]QWC09769.1 energy-coupling factor ABC transporter ATP-binding protein [Arthrobacter jiangjiafuii]